MSLINDILASLKTRQAPTAEVDPFAGLHRGRLDLRWTQRNGRISGVRVELKPNPDGPPEFVRSGYEEFGELEPTDPAYAIFVDASLGGRVTELGMTGRGMVCACSAEIAFLTPTDYLFVDYL